MFSKRGDVVPCDVIPCDVVPCDVIPCDVVPCDVVPCDVVPCDVVPCDVVPCDVIPCDVVPCDVVPCVPNIHGVEVDQACRAATCLCFPLEKFAYIFAFACHETKTKHGLKINSENIMFGQFGSWVCIELRDGMRLEPTHYAVRHGLVRKLCACNKFRC